MTVAHLDTTDTVTNVIFAGLGGQGVLTASGILARIVFDAGYDVKKSEVHGMAQRGGSVSSDVRFGPEVLSPMVPAGAADFVVVLAEEEVDRARTLLRRAGTLITPAAVEGSALPSRKCLNVALLGELSAYLSLPEAAWLAAIKASLPPKLHADNERAFAAGRAAGMLLNTTPAGGTQG
jgi:indolepyruvate ferredoxin oxidoreductase beta subunit